MKPKEVEVDKRGLGRDLTCLLGICVRKKRILEKIARFLAYSLDVMRYCCLKQGPQKSHGL